MIDGKAYVTLHLGLGIERIIGRRHEGELGITAGRRF